MPMDGNFELCWGPHRFLKQDCVLRHIWVPSMIMRALIGVFLFHYIVGLVGSVPNSKAVTGHSDALSRLKCIRSHSNNLGSRNSKQKAHRLQKRVLSLPLPYPLQGNAFTSLARSALSGLAVLAGPRDQNPSVSALVMCGTAGWELLAEVCHDRLFWDVKCKEHVSQFSEAVLRHQIEALRLREHLVELRGGKAHPIHQEAQPALQQQIDRHMEEAKKLNQRAGVLIKQLRTSYGVRKEKRNNAAHIIGEEMVFTGMYNTFLLRDHRNSISNRGHRRLTGARWDGRQSGIPHPEKQSAKPKEQDREPSKLAKRMLPAIQNHVLPVIQNHILPPVQNHVNNHVLPAVHHLFEDLLEILILCPSPEAMIAGTGLAVWEYGNVKHNHHLVQLRAELQPRLVRHHLMARQLHARLHDFRRRMGPIHPHANVELARLLHEHHREGFNLHWERAVLQRYLLVGIPGAMRQWRRHFVEEFREDILHWLQEEEKLRKLEAEMRAEFYDTPRVTEKDRALHALHWDGRQSGIPMPEGKATEVAKRLQRVSQERLSEQRPSTVEPEQCVKRGGVCPNQPRLGRE